MFDQMGVASGMAGTHIFSCVSRLGCSYLAEQVRSLSSVEAEELERELVKAGFTQDHDMQKICLKEDSKASQCVTMCKVYVFFATGLPYPEGVYTAGESDQGGERRVQEGPGQR